MVAHLLRLKLTLLRNGLRRSPWQIVGLVIGGLYALGALALAIAGLIALSIADVAQIRTVLVLTGSVLVLGWWLLSLLAFGVDATLDPARFVTYAIPRRPLLTGLALSGVIGIPGVMTSILVLVAALSWWKHPVAALAALVCAAIAVATCVVGSRATTTVLAPLVGRRRYREVAAVATILPLMLLGPIITAVTKGLAAGHDVLPGFARTAGWTPFGAVWSAPADVADGAWGSAALKLVISLVTLAVLVVVWDRALSKALVTPASAGREGPRARQTGTGAFGRFPATPTGAVAARCLTYWRRDPRYAMSVIVVPLIPVLMFFSAGGVGGRALLISAPVVGFLLGWTISADVAYDSTAFWTHVAAPITGRVDRIGRVVAAGIIGLPTTLVLVVLTSGLAQRWDAIPALIGVSIGLLLTSLGGASVVSAKVVYQVAKPGESPFASHQGASLTTMVSQLVGWGAILALGLPEIVLAIVAIATGSIVIGIVTLVVGLALGSVFLVLGIRIGGGAFDRGAPDLLSRMVSFG